MNEDKNVRDIEDGNEYQKKEEEKKVEDIEKDKQKEEEKDDNHDNKIVVNETKDKKSEVETNADGQVKPRPIYTMPVSKHQAEKKKWQEKEKEYQKQLDELKKNSQNKEEKSESKVLASKEEIEQYADSKGLTYEATEALFEIAERKIQERLKPLENHFKETEILTHKQQVEKEFINNIMPLIQRDFPNADNKFIETVKQNISELAFSARYNQYPLEDIYAVRKSDLEYQNKYSVESSGGVGKRDTIDYSKVSDTDIEKMSSAEYKRYSDYMAKNESSYYSGDE